MKTIVHLREPLVEGKHFRRLSAREGAGRYRFALLEDVTFVHPGLIVPLDQTVSFRDQHHKEWMRMTCKTQTIRKDYWWNGNTPKLGIQIFGRSFWFGTPDFAPTIPASLKHDTDFQFSGTDHYPFSWERANLDYYHIATDHGFKLAGAYHGALQDFSRGAWGKSNGCYSKVL